MARYYNIFYYYILIFRGIHTPHNIINTIKEHKMKNIFILFQVCIFSGIIALASALLNNNIMNKLGNVDPEKVQKLFYGVAFISGLTAPLAIIFVFYIFFILTAKLQVIMSEHLRKEIFSIATIAYLPILFGTLINFILSLTFGFTDFGYITAYGIFEPENKILVHLTQELNPFKIIAIAIACYLYVSTYNKSKKTFWILFITWYFINLLLVALLG
ncbi:hypothetical protein ILT06_29185 [Bacillus sp. 17RED48]|uniref:Yip1 domain-containing protein n=1 Tax=Bacillus cereus HuB4-4 TaxID=1053211 RepID=A0A9W5QN29_BACCE|nr:MULTISPECIES: hypothetical protein [Bacillus]EOP79187.1 hypothetical protein IGM_06397 [Bacillus cereus HuB4-4]MBY7114886.1 hypothetical protein [Bacillus sp. 17RED48]MCU4863604.1 hypothetical protein [Bacillus cereus]MCU4948682.1 hypothetical protein [Bacillus cereus]